MKQYKPSPAKIPATDWQIIGELELPIVAEFDAVVSAWLAKTLNSFNLHTDFLSRVTRSAQDAAGRAITSGSVQREFEHIHLCLFVPRTDLFTLYKEQTWGFFRIEKMGSSTENGNLYDHTMEILDTLEIVQNKVL